MRKRLQDVCQHRNRSREGTNSFMLKETCKDCGKILRHEQKPLANYTKKAMSRRSSSPSRDSVTSGPAVPAQVGRSSSSRQASHEEYQEFLNWRRMKEVMEDSSSSPTFQRQGNR